MSLDAMPTNRSYYSWAVAAALLVALSAYWMWPSSLDSSSNMEVPPSLAKVLTQQSDVVDLLAGAPQLGAPPMHEGSLFWVQVAEHLDSESGTIDSDQVRNWLADQSNLAQRKREAAALLAALNDIPTTSGIQPDVGVSAISANPAVKPATNPAKVHKSPAKAAKKGAEVSRDTPPAHKVKTVTKIAGSARFWNPKRLPTNLRKFDYIFAISDKKEAAKRLRKYIHARHKRVEKVFELINAYLSIAPVERSITVLEQMRAAKPGPKTRYWVIQNLKRLKKSLDKSH
jgi:hypothetical protein